LGAVLGFLDLALWHPGVDAWDQVKVVALAQEAREGLALPWRSGGSAFYLAALQRALAWGGAHAALWRLPNLLAYALESLLLWHLARRAAGARAAFGAILFNSAAALTWLRLRCLLGFVLLPAELLVLIWLAQGRGFWRSLALGLGLGLILFEYEAALLALPIVLLWAGSQAPEQRPRVRWTALGFALVLPFLITGSLSTAANYAAVRLGPNAGQSPFALLGTGLRELWRFVSGHGRQDLLLERLPALPLWSLPLLLLGLVLAWRRQRVLLGWLALGLAPLVLQADVAEAQRTVAAWPAFCLLAGLGFSAAWGHLGALRPLLILALSAGIVGDARAYAAMQDRVEPLARGHWRLMESAASALRPHAAAGPIQILCGLNWRSQSELRALVPSTPGATETWAVLSADYAGPRPAAWGQWQLLEDPLLERRLWLLQVAPAQRAVFEARNAALERFRATAAPTFDNPGLMAATRAALDGPLGQDPWERQALVDLYLYTAIDSGQGPSAWLPLLLAQPHLSVSQAAMAAQALSSQDPRLALALAESAMAQDPWRPGLQALRDRLRQQISGRP
jgi:hypothetical protein